MLDRVFGSDCRSCSWRAAWISGASLEMRTLLISAVLVESIALSKKYWMVGWGVKACGKSAALRMGGVLDRKRPTVCGILLRVQMAMWPPRLTPQRMTCLSSRVWVRLAMIFAYPLGVYVVSGVWDLLDFPWPGRSRAMRR